MRQAEGGEAATIRFAGPSGWRRCGQSFGSNGPSAAGATALRGGAEAVFPWVPEVGAGDSDSNRLASGHGHGQWNIMRRQSVVRVERLERE